MYIVTGGAGFIGSQVVRDLIKQGESVVVLDDVSTGHRRDRAGLPEDPLTIAGFIADMPLDAGLSMTLDWMKTVRTGG